MTINNLKQFMLITGIVFLIDWILGVAQAQHIIPTWTFLILNFPVGIIFVVMEYSWTGTYYSIYGYRMGDMGSLMGFLSVVLVQSYLYYLLYSWWSKRDCYEI